jgi:hypothetical protein
MAAPEYIVCINCETPCYIFEWKDDQLAEAFCEVCGNEDVEEFLSPEDFDTLIGS